METIVVVALLTMYLIWILKQSLTKERVKLNEKDSLWVFCSCLSFCLISGQGMFGLFSVILLSVFTKEIWTGVIFIKDFIQKVIKECYYHLSITK